MARIGVVGEPGAWSTERLAEALRAVGAEACVIDLAACAARLPGPGLVERGRALGDLDAVVVKKIGDSADGWHVRERLELLRHLEATGVPVWSRPAALEMAVDRARMTVELVRAGLPIPETVITDDADEASDAVRRFGAAVLKPVYTSKGRGMRRLDGAADVKDALERHRRNGRGPFYVQRLVEHRGRDLGVAVLDGRSLGAYWRVAGRDQWMTTILAGGRYETADPPPEAEALARRAARHFGLLFTGVDLVEADGRWLVLEVSAFGGFRGLLEAAGVDAAAALAEAVLTRVASR